RKINPSPHEQHAEYDPGNRYVKKMLMIVVRRAGRAQICKSTRVFTTSAVALKARSAASRPQCRVNDERQARTAKPPEARPTGSKFRWLPQIAKSGLDPRHTSQ